MQNILAEFPKNVRYLLYLYLRTNSSIPSLPNCLFTFPLFIFPPMHQVDLIELVRFLPPTLHQILHVISSEDSKISAVAFAALVATIEGSFFISFSLSLFPIIHRVNVSFLSLSLSITHTSSFPSSMFLIPSVFSVVENNKIFDSYIAHYLNIDGAPPLFSPFSLSVPPFLLSFFIFDRAHSFFSLPLYLLIPQNILTSLPNFSLVGALSSLPTVHV